MPTGTVKWFDAKKGFGFIVNSAGQDVFVHFSSIECDGFRSLKDGEPVEYEEKQGDKGLSAVNVKRTSPKRVTVQISKGAAVLEKVPSPQTVSQ